jgi:hypothetical protein
MTQNPDTNVVRDNLWFFRWMLLKKERELQRRFGDKKIMKRCGVVAALILGSACRLEKGVHVMNIEQDWTNTVEILGTPGRCKVLFMGFDFLPGIPAEHAVTAIIDEDDNAWILSSHILKFKLEMHATRLEYLILACRIFMSSHPIAEIADCADWAFGCVCANEDMRKTWRKLLSYECWSRPVNGRLRSSKGDFKAYAQLVNRDEILQQVKTTAIAVRGYIG